MTKSLRKAVIASFLLGSTLPAFSADYITENLSTYMRKGAGDQYKISGAIQAGEKITVLDRKDRFVLVRDSRNREGWVLASEISQTASPKDLIPQLQQQVQELSTKLGKIDFYCQERTDKMIRRSHVADKQTCDVLAEIAHLIREVVILKNKYRSLESMQDSEKRAIAIQYFIYGGSVLVVGLILGLILPFILPRRKRNNGWS